jgi:hypothetical protein
MSTLPSCRIVKFNQDNNPVITVTDNNFDERRKDIYIKKIPPKNDNINLEKPYYQNYHRDNNFNVVHGMLVFVQKKYRLYIKNCS